jgi:prepilin-type processing-associated H-X9-DG protein
MEPRDLDASLLSGIVSPPDGRNMASYHPSGANAAFADGSVRFLSSSIDPQTLRGLTTTAGNEVVQDY